MATLCSTNPKKDNPGETSKAKRKFVWLEDSGRVSIVMFCENGYYFESVTIPADEARKYWKYHTDNGWICTVKKTTTIQRETGGHLQREAARIRIGDSRATWLSEVSSGDVAQ